MNQNAIKQGERGRYLNLGGFIRQTSFSYSSNSACGRSIDDSKAKSPERKIKQRKTEEEESKQRSFSEHKLGLGLGLGLQKRFGF